MTNEVVLKLSDITMQFGGVVAVDNLNLEVHKNEIVGLIGPNGAGKTTAFNVVTGVYEPTNGAVHINGLVEIENYPKGKMAKPLRTSTTLNSACHAHEPEAEHLWSYFQVENGKNRRKEDD